MNWILNGNTKFCRRKEQIKTETLIYFSAASLLQIQQSSGLPDQTIVTAIQQLVISICKVQPDARSRSRVADRKLNKIAA